MKKPVSGYSNSSNAKKLDTLLRGSVSAQNDDKIGIATFECSICGEKGSLLFVLLPDSIPSASGFLFDKEDGSAVYKHKEQLRPGRYKWYFNNYDSLKTEGVMIVRQDEETTIRLFHK